MLMLKLARWLADSRSDNERVVDLRTGRRQ
jgi:hypothetical protein